MHGDDIVGLGAEVHLEWFRQQVSKKLIMKLGGYLGFAARAKREMRILNRVFTWRSSEAGRAEVISYEGDPRHVDLSLRDHSLDGKSRGKTVPWDKPAFLAKSPLAGAYLPADKARSFNGRCTRNLFIALDLPGVQQRNQQCAGAADDQRRRNTEGARQVLLHMPSQIVRLRAR